MSSRLGAAWLAALTALAATACEEGATAVLIKLQPAEQDVDGAELAAILTSLELLFDAEGGFEGLEGDDAPAGLFARDADGDGQPELLQELNVSGRDSLPVVRVEAGHNADRQIAIQARGIDADGEVAAYGAVEPRVLFVRGRVSEVQVPLFRSLRYLPPRIIGVAPQSIPSAADPWLRSFSFHASRPLDPASLAGHVEVELVDGDSNRVPVSVGLEPRACAYGTEEWPVVPDDCYCAGYRGIELRIGPEVTDRSGQPLGAQAVFSLPIAMQCFGTCTGGDTPFECGQQTPTHEVDTQCNVSAGAFEAGACTLLRQACDPAHDQFSWISAADAAACQELRHESTLAEGTCVVTDPWPCTAGYHCGGGGHSCDGNQCTPDPCSDSCSDPDLACAPQGCLPRMGTCVETCEASGACPELGQRCLRDDDGTYACR